ncbi:uncharacterized protein BKA55DRAFT_724453 [Fusarium redolens]|uniref:Apple domain-containing protein n=1 Tax=Fusarium redolens TaxID=48865 RepID=A0A9P9HLR7_FUSRE|nr:uncharacterized protein BKA55DRAFT_724453 [Fusarium redolens]KAH7259397.1 hypothetical protein BKA55DRAFT_724453 [Fusarium redolens]
MVAAHFLILYMAAAVAVAGPCKLQSSSVIFSETTLSTSLLETTSTEVPIETPTVEPTSTAVVQTSVTSAAETTAVTAVTTLSSVETTTEAASTTLETAAPPQGISCLASDGECFGAIKIECGYIITGGFSLPFLSTLDACVGACNDNSGCAGFSHNGVNCYLVSTYDYATAPSIGWVAANS